MNIHFECRLHTFFTKMNVGQTQLLLNNRRDFGVRVFIYCLSLGVLSSWWYASIFDLLSGADSFYMKIAGTC